MDAGQRSTKVSSAPAPAVKRILEPAGYFDGYTWAEVFRDPLVLALTVLHLFFFWYLCRDKKLMVELSARKLLGITLLLGVAAQYALMFLFGKFDAPAMTTTTAAASGSDGSGRGPAAAAGPIGRTTTRTSAPSPAAAARIVVDAAAQPVVSVFCNPCGAYLSLKWCMGLDKYVIGCSCPSSDIVVEHCIDSRGQRQLRICIPSG